MSKEAGIVALGIWLAILPFLGFPGSWRTVFVFLSGAGVAALGFLVRAETLSRSRGFPKDASFTQNTFAGTSHETHQEGRV